MVYKKYHGRLKFPKYFTWLAFFNSLKRKSEDIKETKVSTPIDIVLLTEIRDLLKNKHYFNLYFHLQSEIIG